MAVSSWVESVEFIDTSIPGTSTSIALALTKGQNYANCVPFYTIYGSGDYWDSRLTDVYFSGSEEFGTINFRRYDIRSANVVYIKCYVIEFNPEQVRVQQGYFNVDSSTTNTVTLPTTLSGTDRAAMTFGWRANNGSQYPQKVFVRGRVISTTQIDFYRNNTTNSCNGHWFLFEDLEDNFRVTHKHSSFAGTGQSINIDSGRQVDPLRTFLLGSYAASSTTTGYATRWSTRQYLYSNGNIRWDKSDSAYHTIYWASQIVEIQDKTKVYTPFDHYTDGWTSGTTRVRAVGGTSRRVPWLCNLETSSIVTGCMQGIARGTSTSSAQINELLISASLTASGTITKYKDGGSYATYPSYTLAIDWAGIDVDTGTADPADVIPEGTGPGKSFVKTVENFRFEIEDYFGARVLTKGQNWENCAIFSSHRAQSAGTRVRENMADVYLVEPGIVCFKCWDKSGQTYVDVSVVEFWPDQVRVQHKTIYTAGATTTNVSIDTISDVNKAFVLSKVFFPGNEQHPSHAFCRVHITSTTNVQVYKYASGYEVSCSFFVVEDLGDNFVTKHKTGSFSDSNESWYDDSKHWGVYQTFILASYAVNGDDLWPSRTCCRNYYVSENRPLYMNKSDGTYRTIYFAWTLVRFVSNMYHTQAFNRTFYAASYTRTYSANFTGHEHALTCYTNNNMSVGRVNSTTANYIADAFNTIRITDYETRTIEESKPSHSATSYGSSSLIDWIGYHYHDANNIEPGTPTRSKPIVSLQKYTANSTTSFFNVALNKGQDVNQCVPFITNSAGASDGEVIRLYKVAYRYEDPDFFRIRFGSSQTAARDFTLNILEFAPEVKVQYGTAYSTGTSVIKTIEEVNLDRAFLHFYSFSDSWYNYNEAHAVCGRFLSSTSIKFIRTNSNEAMYIAYYIVECPEDGEDSFWRVMREYKTALGAAASVYASMPNIINCDRTLFLASWSSDNTNYPTRGFYRAYNNQATRVYFNKNDGTYYDMEHLYVQAIEFNKDLHKKGLRVLSDFVTLSTTNPVNLNLRVTGDDRFHIYRSIATNMNQGNECRTTTTATTGYAETLHHLEFVDDGDGYAQYVEVRKVGASHTTYNYVYATQFPEFNKYYYEGYVTDLGVPVQREVLAYRTSTGELVDKTVSASGTGYFWVETPYSDLHHVVCLDDEAIPDYNALIYSDIVPTVISGTFAYKEGQVTTSGFEIGIPLGRL